MTDYENICTVITVTAHVFPYIPTLLRAQVIVHAYSHTRTHTHEHPHTDRRFNGLIYAHSH